jgi:hypothetical protein
MSFIDSLAGQIKASRTEVDKGGSAMQVSRAPIPASVQDAVNANRQGSSVSPQQRQAAPAANAPAAASCAGE